MHSERFRPLLTGAGPYASVYFDDSHDTADATAQLKLKWRGLREELDGRTHPPRSSSTYSGRSSNPGPEWAAAAGASWRARTEC